MPALRTNGIGSRTQKHLNLTTSLADKWKIKPEPELSVVKPAPERKQYRLKNGIGYLSATKDGYSASLEAAYQGNADECLETCASCPIAANMVMELVD